MSGIVIINKGEGISSQGVVKRVGKLFSEKKAGHTGTLDPLATGVLPVLIGRAVKASEYMLSSDKYYRATLRLGFSTDTEDITGECLSVCTSIPSEEEVLSVIASFVGEIQQVPPMYSALKVGGKKLCDMARAGQTIERVPRRVSIFSIRAEKISETDYSLDIHCSKGTYIRTLCADIGKALGCGGVMAALCRTKASHFTLEDAYTLEQIEAMPEERRAELIIPVERIFENLPKVTLEPFFSRLALAGAEIYLSKIGADLGLGQRVRLYHEKGFFALGEVREFEGGLAVKPIKLFEL